MSRSRRQRADGRRLHTSAWAASTCSSTTPATAYRGEIGALDVAKMKEMFDTNIFGLVDHHEPSRAADEGARQRRHRQHRVDIRHERRGHGDGATQAASGRCAASANAGRPSCARTEFASSAYVRRKCRPTSADAAGATTRTSSTRLTSRRRSWPRSTCRGGRCGPSSRCSRPIRGKKTEAARIHEATAVVLGGDRSVVDRQPHTLGPTLLYPFKLFTTWVHETSHALMTVLVGGRVTAVTIGPDTSGLTHGLVPAEPRRPRTRRLRRLSRRRPRRLLAHGRHARRAASAHHPVRCRRVHAADGRGLDAQRVRRGRCWRGAWHLSPWLDGAWPTRCASSSVCWPSRSRSTRCMTSACCS